MNLSYFFKDLIFRKLCSRSKQNKVGIKKRTIYNDICWWRITVKNISIKSVLVLPVRNLKICILESYLKKWITQKIFYRIYINRHANSGGSWDLSSKKVFELQDIFDSNSHTFYQKLLFSHKSCNSWKTSYQ
jgi:hypothetical protein